MRINTLFGILMICFVNFSPAGRLDNYPLPNQTMSLRQDEFLLDTGVVSIPGIGEQRQPAVAFDGTNYLVMWTDYRNGSPVICGSRMDQEGNLLDEGIFMPNLGGYQSSPAIAFDGVNYLVIWMEENPNPTLSTRGYFLLNGARVNLNGSLIDTIPLIINRYVRGRPKIVFGGGQYFITWASGNITATRVTPTGVVLDTAGIIYGGGMEPTVATSNNNYLIVTKGQNGANIMLIGYLVNLNGTAIDTIIIFMYYDFWCRPELIFPPKVLFHVSNYFVVWDFRDTTFTDFDANIIGARVTQNGVLIDTIPIRITNNNSGQFCPDLAFDGINYLAVWIESHMQSPESYNIFGARISPDGVVLDTSGLAISSQVGIQSCPAVTAGNGGFLAVWQNFRNCQLGTTDIYFTQISSAGNVTNPMGTAIRTSVPYRQDCSAVAFDGTNYLAVWQDYRNSSFPFFRSEIYGIRLSGSGSILDPGVIQISALLGDTSRAIEYTNPMLCYGGSRYLMIYDKPGMRNSDSIIQGMFIDPEGSISDTFTIHYANSNSSYCLIKSIAFGDSIFLLTFWDYVRGIKGCRITQSGRILDPNGFLIYNSYTWFKLQNIFGNDNFLVLWAHNGINAKRVALDGTVLDSLPFNYPALKELSASYDGNNYFIVGSKVFWPDTAGIFGYRINQNGILLDTNMITIALLHNQYMQNFEPIVDFDGTNYIVVWSALYDFISHDLYSAKVSPQGQVLSVTRIVGQAGDQSLPVLSRGNADRMLLIYSGWTNNINGHPASTQRIWGKMYPFYGLQEKSLANDIALDFLTVQPNPFRNRTEIRFNTGKESDNSGVTLKIFDVTGRLVKSIGSSSIVSRPSSFVNWDGTDQAGRKVSAGIYFVRLSGSNRELIQKIVLLK